MATTVSFGGTTVNGPDGDQPYDSIANYVTALTQGGNRYSYKKSAASQKLWTLSFKFVTSSQRAALQTFFDGTAKGPTNTFTYIHTNGQSLTVRFAQPQLTWSRVTPNVWATSIQLEIVAGNVNS